MILTCVINGVEVPLIFSPSPSLSVSLARVLLILTKASTLANPPEDWQIRNAAGQLLDKEDTLDNAGLVDGDRLFFNLAVGSGG